MTTVAESHAADPQDPTLEPPTLEPQPPDAARERELPPDEKGAVLKGRFELVERIGVGGMSTVYKAVDRERARSASGEPFVAVKIVRRDIATRRDPFAALEREASQARTLEHPNIVRVFDCDRDGDTLFLTMEYLAGASLARKLPAVREDKSDRAALAVIRAVGEALAFAHRNGVVHGDLKPSNVFLTDSGEVKVIDFGVARLLPRRAPLAQPPAPASAPLSSPLPAPPSASPVETPPPSGPAVCVATPAYASPEMLRGREPDPRDDVYAFACVAYTVLTGNHPFDRKSSIAAREAKLEPALHANLSRKRHEALAAALAFERAKRTPTVEALVAALMPPPRKSGASPIRI